MRIQRVCHLILQILSTYSILILSLTSIQKSFDSLIEARISLRLTEAQRAAANFPQGEEEEEMVRNANEFLTGLCNVQILSLSAQALAFCCEATPVFKNLTQLTIESDSNIGWESLPGLLMNCPRLETLFIRGLGHKHNDGCGNVCCCKHLENVPSCLSSSPVKVLKIVLFVPIDGDGMEIG
ncbi:hypothetical protein AALP_AAs55242U000100 [Arabis alpina]|uniref:FBD domain-containing protein n=1 Tax=Arabis alpina TaxID=50452 RepID=A0A087FZ87_ARAAL|nr:hypothetical protein AALP_AAs55242U000100 [Arabis alpina]